MCIRDRIEGVSEELCERFSKRDAQIDKAVAKLLAGKPELAGTNIKDLRERLATAERTRKQKDLSRDELQSLWDAQMCIRDRDGGVAGRGNWPLAESEISGRFRTRCLLERDVSPSTTWQNAATAVLPIGLSLIHISVTIYYSDLIAGLLSRLKHVPDWSPAMLNVKLRASKWFL